MQWMALLEQSLAALLPIGFGLLIKKRLRAFDIFHPRQTVGFSPVAQALRIESARQPLSPVEADVHLERKPRLQAQMAKAPFLVLPVKVIVQALSPFHAEPRTLGLRIAPNAPTPARLHRAKDGDQSLFDPALFSRRSRQILFAQRARANVAD